MVVIATMEICHVQFYALAVICSVLSCFHVAAAEGIYINCGGPSITGYKYTWQADKYFLSGNVYDLSFSDNVKVESSGTGVDNGVFSTMRYFSDYESLYGYSIPVGSKGYYLVRLYFAEISYLYNNRSFSVSIEGFPFLEEYEVSKILKATMKEFFVSVDDYKVDISFFPGSFGEPMVNAIAVVAAPAQLYEQPSGSTVAFATESRLSCGGVRTIEDSLGRLWEGDMKTGLYNPPDKEFKKGLNATFYTISSGVNAFIPNLPTGSSSLPSVCDLEPNVLPLAVYQTQRSTVDSDQPLIYNFRVQKKSKYWVRVGWAYSNSQTNNIATLYSSIDNVSFVEAVDLQKVSDGLFLQNSYVTANISGKLSIKIFNPISNSSETPRNLFVNSIELYRITQFNNTIGNLVPVQSPTPPPPPPPPPKGRPSNTWKGIAIGASFPIAISILVTIIATFFTTEKVIKWLNLKKEKKEKEKNEEVLNKKTVSDSISEKLSYGFPSSTDSFGDFFTSKKLEELSRYTNLGTRVYSFTELNIACNEFSIDNLIGVGESGSVYKGKTSDGSIIAIKKTDIDFRELREEIAFELGLEVLRLCQLHHRNLGNLIGYSMEGPLLIVSEFATNGALIDCFRESRRSRWLSWPKRLKLATEAARGIRYLHMHAAPPLKHGGIRSSCFLLNEVFETKVADFGLENLEDCLESSQKGEKKKKKENKQKNSKGYMDADCLAGNEATEESDIYSFGVVLLELLTGRSPYWIEYPDQKLQSATYLVDWAVPFLEKGEVEDILAPEVSKSVFLPSISQFAEIARQCLVPERTMRPQIDQVLRDLEDVTRNLISTLTQSTIEAQKIKLNEEKNK